MIRFEFQGGPKDGEVVVHGGNSLRATADADLAEGGRLGAIPWCTTKSCLDVAEHLSTRALHDLRNCGMPIRGHLYESCAQWQMDCGLRVKMRHLGAYPDSACKSPPISMVCDSWNS